MKLTCFQLTVLGLIGGSVDAASMRRLDHLGPECYQVGSTLLGKGLGAAGAKCVHYEGANVCECASAPKTFADGRMVNEDGTVLVQGVDADNSPFQLNLYSESPTMFEEAKYCPPPSYFNVNVPCEKVTEIGQCCTDGSSVTVAGLPDFIGCVHDTTTWNAYEATGSDVTWAGSPDSVEVYASNKNRNSCGNMFMYELACTECTVSSTGGAGGAGAGNDGEEAGDGVNAGAGDEGDAGSEAPMTDDEDDMAEEQEEQQEEAASDAEEEQEDAVSDAESAVEDAEEQEEEAASEAEEDREDALSDAESAVEDAEDEEAA